MAAVLAPFAHGVAPAPKEISIACDAVAQQFRFGAENAAIALRIDDGPAWLQLEESGQQMRTEHFAEMESIRITQPLRLGQEWLRVTSGARVYVRRAEPDSAAGGVAATLHCGASPTLDRRIDWLRRLSRIERRINVPIDRGDVLRTVPLLQDLEASAGDDRARALAVHLHAMALSAANEPASAAQEFAKAELSWRAAGNSEHARTAHLGLVEGEGAAGDRTGVIADTDAVAERTQTLDYVDARMLNERCITFDDLGRFAAAAACYEPLLARLKALDERAEYVNTLGNFANTQRKLGHLDLARALALRGLDVQGPNAPIMRGRLYQLLVAIDRERGDIASALGHIEAANSEFASAGSAALLGRAALSLDEAMLLEQIGSRAEAYAGLQATFSLLAPMQLLALRAKIFSDLEADTRHYQSASFWARIAEASFAREGLAPARDATRLDRMRLLLRLGATSEVAAAIAENHDVLPLYQSRWELLAAELAVEQNHLEEARAALDQLRGNRLPLRDQLRYAAAEAQYDIRNHDAPAAQQLLLATARRTGDLAMRAGNPVLRRVISRQSLPLQRLAFDLALDPALPASSGSAAIATIWDWLALEQVGSARASDLAVFAKAESFDRAVAAELLPSLTASPGQQLSSERALISVLAEPERRSTASVRHTASLADVQHQLDDSSAFAAFIDGDSRGAVLWITADDARLVDTAPPARLLSGAASLNSLLRSPDSPVSEIQAAARQLSTDLLGPMTGIHAPRHLYVLSNESSNGIVWSLLSWPGSSEPLLTTSSVSLVHVVGEYSARRATSKPPDEVRVLLASQQAPGNTPLPALAGAAAEADLIRSSLADRTIKVTQDAHATRASMLGALTPAGAWIHVAAHGLAEPQRIGFAGVWLETAAGANTPAFLSWLDVLDHGVGADLVVLDACQSADAAAAVPGNLSFADAVSRAGANHVVAALWPVSDSAAALWVPAFYQALTADPGHDAAQALRAAQQRLRSSRAFTHPFYWAGLQAIERLDIATPARAASR